MAVTNLPKKRMAKKRRDRAHEQNMLRHMRAERADPHLPENGAACALFHQKASITTV